MPRSFSFFGSDQEDLSDNSMLLKEELCLSWKVFRIYVASALSASSFHTFLFFQIGAVFVWSYVYNIIRICGTESDGNVQISSTISKNQSAEINSSDSSSEELLLKGCPSSQDYHVQPTFVLKRSEDGVKVIPFPPFCLLRNMSSLIISFSSSLVCPWSRISD